MGLLLATGFIEIKNKGSYEPIFFPFAITFLVILPLRLLMLISKGF